MSVSSGGEAYTCPMHPAVRQGKPGRCPECDVPLLPEGTRFALLRYVVASPVHLTVIGIALTALALAAILLLR